MEAAQAKAIRWNWVRAASSPALKTSLIGAKAGDKVDVTVNFPAEYGAQHLAGKEAVFECTVHGQGPPRRN